MADAVVSDVLRGADRRLTPARADLAAAHLEGSVDSARFVTGTPMQVRTASAPLFPSPNAEGPMDTELLFGERFDVYETRDGWVWGQAARDGYVGYAPEAVFTQDVQEPTHTVRVPRSSVYRSDDIKTVPLDMLSMTAMLTIDAVDGNFARLANGCCVPVTHIAPVDETEPDFVAVAETFLHTPYVWGGKTASGFDCSALVQLSLARAGIPAPRDSDMQAAGIGRLIGNDETPQRGDLLFWKGHVGIATDSETLLHCTEYTMRTLKEPLADARQRIEGRRGIPLLCIRRPAPKET